MDVTIHISAELNLPIVCVGLRHTSEAATVMLVPEATVHEDGFTLAYKDEVGPSRQILPVKPVAVAEPMCQSPNDQLGRSVRAPNPTHVLASLRWGDSLRHYP